MKYGTNFVDHTFAAGFQVPEDEAGLRIVTFPLRNPASRLSEMLREQGKALRATDYAAPLAAGKDASASPGGFMPVI
jgi:hypothetical protein